MWQRFTERSRRVILLAQEEAGRLDSGKVGTEHLLLGMLREEEGAGFQVVRLLQVDRDALRQAALALCQPEPTVGEPKLTPRAKRVLELAADEARRLHHNYIGTEHLLLALIREKDGHAATVLRGQGMSVQTTREAVVTYLNSVPNETPSLEPTPRVVSPTSKSWLTAWIERVLRKKTRE